MTVIEQKKACPELIRVFRGLKCEGDAETTERIDAIIEGLKSIRDGLASTRDGRLWVFTQARKLLGKILNVNLAQANALYGLDCLIEEIRESDNGL